MQIETLLSNAGFVRGLARRLIADDQLAEDVVQETWIAALERPPTEKAAARAWLFKVVRNLSFRLMRRERIRSAHERAAFQPKRTPSACEVLERERARLRLMEAVLALEEPYRSAVMLRFYEGLPPREIAGQLQIPVETVKTHLKRGLARLRERLNAEYGGDRSAWMTALAPLAGIDLTAPAAGGAAAAGTVLTEGLAMAAKVKAGILAATVVALVLSVLVLVGEQEKSGVGELAGPAVSETLHGAVAVPASDGASPADADDRDDTVPIEPRAAFARLSGRVLSRANETGIVGARVEVNRLPFCPDAAAVQATTEPDGRFSVDVPTPAEGRTAGLILHFSADGYQDFETSLPLEEGAGAIDAGSFLLRENSQYAIRIVDEAAQPVAGAEIEFYNKKDGAPVWTKTSDSGGYVRFAEQEMALWADSPVWDAFMLHVSAAGFLDHLHLCYLALRNRSVPEALPDQLVLQQAGSLWPGFVRDEVTGLGISGAEIAFQPPFEMCSRLAKTIAATTDSAGRFAIPRITHSGNEAPRFVVVAEGYMEAYADLPSSDAAPLDVRLKPPSRFVDCVAVEAQSGEPMPGIEIRRANRDVKMAADESGFFRVPVWASDNLSYGLPRLSAYAPESGARYESERISVIGDRCLTVPFNRVVAHRLEVRVRDELGRPVAGAYVRLYYPPDAISPQEGANSDHAGGSAVFDLRLAGAVEAAVLVDRTGFCSTKTAPFRVDPAVESDPGPGGATQVLDVVLRRGVRFQKLKIVEAAGSPPRYAGYPPVLADLVLEDGSACKLEAYPDADGCCEMTFPPFREGTVCVRNRPDTLVRIDHASILKNDWITLFLPREVRPECAITGTVVDEEGLPLKGVSIMPVVTAGSQRHLVSVKTDENGAFSIPVFENEVFSLRFFSTRSKDGRGYVAKDETGVRAGARLAILMSATSSVQVYFGALLRKIRASHIDYDAWLESADGKPLAVEEVLKSPMSAEFRGIPDGTMRAVIVTKEGSRYQTDLFEVKDGASPGTVHIGE